MIKVISQTDIALFIRYFREHDRLSINDLRKYFVQITENNSDYAFKLWLFELMDMKIINITGNYFKIIKFYPLVEVNSTLSKLNSILSRNFRGVKYCLLSTEWLNEFNRYQANFSYNVLEIERDLIESTFDILRERFKRKVFIYEEKNILERYVYGEDDTIVIKNIIARAPLNLISPIKNKRFAHSEQYESNFDLNKRKTEYIPVPSLEKMLVDLFCDRNFYYAFSGSVLLNIFENALSKYYVDLRVLFSFAERRNVTKKVEEFIFDNFFYILEKNRGLL
jgi:hypothetical protein